MDKKTINLIKKHLRSASLKWSGRNEALKKARRKVERRKKDGTLHSIPFTRYQCRLCKEIYEKKDVEVDHIIDIGQFDSWSSYIGRMFCDLSLLQVLCKKCHLKKKEIYDKIKI